VRSSALANWVRGKPFSSSPRRSSLQRRRRAAAGLAWGEETKSRGFLAKVGNSAGPQCARWWREPTPGCAASSKRRASSSAAASIAPLPTPFTLQNPNPAHRRNAVWLLFGEVTDTRDANTEGTGTDAQRRERKKLLPATGDARWVAGAVRGYQRLLCRLAPEHLARATPRVAAAAKRLAKVGLWEAAAELLLAVFPAFEGSRAATATEDDDADPDTVERETPGSIAAVEAHVDVATFLVDRLYASTYVRSSERDTEDLVVAVLLSSDAVNVMQRVVGQSSRSPGAPGTASDGIGSSGGDGGDGGGSGVSTVGGPRVQSGAVAPTAGMLSAGGGDDLFGGGGGGAWILTPGDHPAAAAAVMPSGTAAAAATTLAATSRPLILPPQFSTPMARLGAALHAHARALALAAQHVGLGAMTLEAAARMPSPLLIWPLYHDPTSVRRTTVEGAAAMMAAALAPPVDGGGGGTEEAEGAAAADGGGAQGDDESDAEDAGDEGGTEQTGQSIPTAAATAATEIAAPAATVYRHRDMNLWSKRDHAAVRFSEAAAAAASARRIWERLRDRRREAAAVAVEAEVMYCEASALSASLHLQTADQQMGVLIINILQLCAPAIALFRKSVEILEGCGCGVTVEAATAMKDLGKTLGFVSRFLPVMPNHIASNLFGQRMPWWGAHVTGTQNIPENRNRPSRFKVLPAALPKGVLLTQSYATSERAALIHTRQISGAVDSLRHLESTKPPR